MAGARPERAKTPPCSSVSSHRDTDMYTKDTVLSTLVLCGIHAGEGSCDAAEELQGKKNQDNSVKSGNILRGVTNS